MEVSFAPPPSERKRVSEGRGGEAKCRGPLRRRTPSGSVEKSLNEGGVVRGRPLPD